MGEQALCRQCVERFAPPVPRCRGCALRLPPGQPTGQPLCGECLRQGPAFEHCVCAADYGFPWDALIAQAKFHARPELMIPLSALLAAAARQVRAPAPALLLPIPLDPQRLRERGYNQAWELARELARHLRCPAAPALLLRPVQRAHQADLSRAQRLANLRGAFMLQPNRQLEVTGQRVALVDDVMTTGATLREAATVLRRAGAGAVDVYVLARTPEAH